ncbi:hypothetical protein JCM8097_007276 [Rhodosporidiobolus ruineniae]
MADSAATGEQERPAKRPRTSTACDQCRKRRAKCDGVKPKCGRCSSMDLPCVYAFDADRRKPVTKDFVTALTMKIAALEKELSEIKSQKGVDVGPSSAADRQAVTDSFCGGLALNSHGELRFYGPTSSFRAILADSTEGAAGAARAWSLTRAPIPYAPPLDPFLPKKPPRLSPELSSKLIKLAFEYCFSQFGLVDERAFMDDLHRSATQRTANYSPLLLHIVLAIGSRYIDPSDPDFDAELCSDTKDPSTRGDVFIHWCRLMVDQEWFHPDISTVRSLTCLAFYLAGQALDGPALMFASQAMRLCEDFGLHLDIHRLQIGSGGIPQALREARRNAFFAAFLMDNQICTYLGRQPLLTFADIDTSLPAVDTGVEFDPPHYRSSSFHAASKLACILSRLLDSVYSLKPGISLAARQAAVPELHLALEEWYHSLPSPLRASMPSAAKAPHPHILGLNALYYSSVIQLHRPFFRRTSDGGDMGVSTDKCLWAAKHIVRLVRLQRDSVGLRFVHPLFQHCCFTAGTILALSATEDSICGVPTRDVERKAQAAADLKSIIEALREIGTKTWKTALTSANVLETFIQSWSSHSAAAASSASQTISIPIVQAPPPLPPLTGQSSASAGVSSTTVYPSPTSSAPHDFSGQGFFGGLGGMGLTTGAFPHIFPSWDLGEAGPSSLDDFMAILNPLTEGSSDGSSTIDPSTFLSTEPTGSSSEVA